jgi:hypothetical protein
MPAPKNIKWAILPICACVFVWLLPDERTPANFNALFHEKGLQLISIEPSTGCYRVSGYRYAARDKAGRVERGLLCVNKSMHVFGMTPSPGNPR